MTTDTNDPRSLSSTDSFLKRRVASICAAALPLTFLACSSNGAGRDVPSGGAGGAGAAGGGALSGQGGALGGASPTGGAGTAGAAGASPGGTSGGGGTSAAGSGGAAGSVTAGGGGGGQSKALVVDDFESGTVGAAPDATKWQVLAESAGSSVAVTSEDFHGGSRAMKIVAGGNFPDHAFFINRSVFPLPAGVVYYRAWVKFQAAPWSGHNTFVKSVGADQAEVRLGGQANFYNANLSVGDGLSPDPYKQPCALCVAPVPSRWTCVEGMFDSMSNRVQAWVDQMLAVDAMQSSDWHTGSGTVPTMLNQLAFGWESYSGTPNTIFFDDVAIGYERIGCQP